MSAKDILIAHGEKAAVLVVVAACGYYLSATFGNPDIRPDNISMEKINQMVLRVEKARADATPPVMKVSSAYFDDMSARWAVTLPSSRYYAFMSAAPDVGPIDMQTSQQYIYELNAPKVSVVDTIGNLELTVTLPGSSANADPRISDASGKTWSLMGREDNRAQWLGLQIEMKVGAGDWQPLVAKGLTNGCVAVTETTSSYPLTIPTVEPWQRHNFRARLIAKATGLPLNQKTEKDQQQTVLVIQGPYAEIPVDWAKLSQGVADVVTGNKDIIARFQNGSTQGPFADQLKGGERLYRSADSDDASVQAQDSIRFVFEKMSQNFDNPEQSGATILMSKYLRDPRAAGAKVGKWIDKPMSFKLLPGEGLGKPENIENPFLLPGAKQGQKVPEDFTTQYVLTEVKLKVPRIIYYEIFTKARPGGGKGKMLEVKPKPMDTEVAVFTNSKTGSTLELPHCEKLIKPNKQLSYFYPDFLGLVYEEVLEFKKNPANFKQNMLIPKPPIAHEPDTGPLEDLFKLRNEPLLKTDTVYYELPDGRIIYWDHVNNNVKVLIKAGSEAATDQAAAEREVAEKAAAEKAAADAAKAAAETSDVKPAPHVGKPAGKPSPIAPPAVPPVPGVKPAVPLPPKATTKP